MEHKSDSNTSDGRHSGTWDEHENSSNEFDDAVTSELAAVRVTGMSLSAINTQKAKYAPSGETDAAEKQTAAAKPADEDTLRPGFLLGNRFEIVALIHSGGMGHVYKAIDRRRHRGATEQAHVAIKMMRRSLAPQLDARRALEREASKTQHLAHPNIVNVFDFDEHDEQFYLVMEWLEGESVNALLRRTSGQRLEPNFAWRIVEGIASGMQHAHANNVVHADINPSNIFITETQEVKLLDFGVARYATDSEHDAGTSSVWVTRTYASPEVLAGMTPTFEDDIFSLACVAYRLLSGTHPFGGKSSIEAQQAGTSVARIPGLSEPRWQTLSRALSYERDGRPNSASAFYEDDVAADDGGPLVNRIGGLFKNRWLQMSALGAILLAGLWWVSQTRMETEPTPVAATTVPEAASPGELQDLLNRAAQAMAEERLIAPDTDNARALYREVLGRDPANARALAGLRAIGDTYVAQANAALQAGNPQQAIDDLAVASETDPANPAIAVVQQLLAVRAAGQLSHARLAAAEGDTQRALELLAAAEGYPIGDVSAIEALRDEISQRATEDQLVAGLAAVDAHIVAGRLLTPVDGNAQALLLKLQKDYRDDPRLLASLNRQAERLLARAGFAAAAQQFSAASALLDAADSLGVMTEELSSARVSLAAARDEARGNAAVATPAKRQASSVQSGTTLTTNTPAAVTAGSAVAAKPPPESTEMDQGGAPAANAETTVAAPAAPKSEPVMSLSDLGIQKYVVPRFPRNARRRGLEGFVVVRFSVNPDGSTGEIETVRAEPGSIFSSSAENAVSKWQFAPRDEVFTTAVTLTFKLAP